MKKSILITGGSGFIGSNFIPYFLEKYPDYTIVNIDVLSYASDNRALNNEIKNLKKLKNNDNYFFIEGDICDRKLIEKIFEIHKITDVIHFAAESHVDNSIKNPEIFIRTNVNGTFILLDVAKKYWETSALFSNNTLEKKHRFHHISTDEVYGTLGEIGLFTEETAYAPNSPYSASKASSDMLVRSYHHTFNLDTIITNCSNNYGPKQHSEKLIPTIIASALAGKKIPIYGDGKNIRDWLYVLDHCKGIDITFHNGVSGETYNIGGRNEKTTLEIAEKICEILDKKNPRSDNKKYSHHITFVEDRAGHDFRYAIDASKIEKKLGWKAEENFESGIEKTVDWYLKNFHI